MAAKAVRDIPEVVTIPHEGAARGRYRKQLRGYPRTAAARRTLKMQLSCKYV